MQNIKIRFCFFCLFFFFLFPALLIAEENTDDILTYDYYSFPNGDLPDDIPCPKEEGKVAQVFKAGTVYDLVTCPDGTQYKLSYGGYPVETDPNAEQYPSPVQEPVEEVPPAKEPAAVPEISDAFQESITTKIRTLGSPPKNPNLPPAHLFLEKNLLPENEQPLLNDWIEQENFQEEIRWLIAHEKFDELEAIADRLREDKERFTSGAWKIVSFYKGLTKGFKETDINNRTPYFQILSRWIASKPDSITAKIALADASRILGWDTRGEGYSSQISEEAFKGFQENLQKAHDQLLTAFGGDFKDPYGYYVWIDMEMGAQSPKSVLHKLVENSMKLDPLFYPTYQIMAVALLPRWYGQEGEVEQFAESILEKTSDVAGYEMYARIADKVRFMASYGETYSNYDFSWEKIKKGFQKILQKYPQDFHSLNSFAWFACFYKDRETAKQLFDEIGDLWNFQAKEIWDSPTYYKLFKNWANTEGAPHPIHDR